MCSTVSLCLASFCTPRPNFPVILGIPCLPSFPFKFPMMKSRSFFLLVLEGILGLHNVVVVLFAQSCPTPCYSMDCTLPVSSVCGILQARILEWIDIPFYRASSWPRDWTGISCIADRFFTNWTTREALVGFHRNDNFIFFGVSGWGIGLDHCIVEWFALEMNWDYPVVFEIEPKYCISDSFVDY